MNIKSLILQGEGEQLDFKNTISNCVKIARTLVAFANNKGGKLLIGVMDDGHVKGVKNEEEEKYMLERAAKLYCRPAVELRFEEVYVDDKLLLVADISESDSKPHYARNENQQWWVYIRVKDESILAGKVVVDVLRRSQETTGILINYTEKEQELLSYFQEHERPKLPELCKHLKLSRRKTQRILVNLVLAGVIAVHHEGREEYYAERPL